MGMLIHRHEISEEITKELEIAPVPKVEEAVAEKKVTKKKTTKKSK